MRSSRPKVLHEIADKALLRHVYDTASQFTDNHIYVVYGHGGEMVKQSLADINVGWVEQTRQLGTGHAVMQVIDFIDDLDKVLILYGDVPLLKSDTLAGLLSDVDANTLALLTVLLDKPTGYGRIVRDNQQAVIKIVEQKDASPQELAIMECNTGILACYGQHLKQCLS